jgi:hypothetical protein
MWWDMRFSQSWLWGTPTSRMWHRAVWHVCRLFGGACFIALFHPTHGVSRFLRNVGKFLLYYMVSHPRRDKIIVNKSVMTRNIKAIKMDTFCLYLFNEIQSKVGPGTSRGRTPSAIALQWGYLGLLKLSSTKQQSEHLAYTVRVLH